VSGRGTTFVPLENVKEKKKLKRIVAKGCSKLFSCRRMAGRIVEKIMQD
jgi:hypothetical protein